MPLDESDLDDAGVVSERELRSVGTSGAPYRTDSIVSVSAGVVTVGVTIPIDGYDDPVSPGDVFVLSGATAGNGTYTVSAVTGQFAFTVAEAIPDSSGGVGSFYFAPGASLVGVDSSGLVNAVGNDVQEVLGELDSAISAGGLTEPQHQVLDTLVHDLSETAVTEVSYSPQGRPTVIEARTAPSPGGVPIRRREITYTGPRVTQVVTIQYDGAGVEVERLTEVFSYVGATTKLSSISATRTP